VLVEKKMKMVLGPTPDEMNESMYLNRWTETAWMIHRLVPFMRRPETPKEVGWDRKWKLLDDSFAMMVDGLAELGKGIAPAFKEMVGAKFAFGPETYYAEKKTQER
jgi:hypothetical protein